MPGQKICKWGGGYDMRKMQRRAKISVINMRSALSMWPIWTRNRTRANISESLAEARYCGLHAHTDTCELSYTHTVPTQDTRVKLQS